MKTGIVKSEGGRAFTLTELLVVIASMAVLSAVVLPALAAAKPRTQHVFCASNLKQLTLAEIMYCDANIRSVPYTAPDGFTGAWFVNLKDYFGGNSNAMMACPVAVQPFTMFSASSVGNAVTSWGRQDLVGGMTYSSSYTFNGWLFTKRSDPNSGDGDGMTETSPGGPAGYYLAGNAVKVPGHTPVFTDGIWDDGWPTEIDAACHDTHGSSGPSSPNLGTGGSIHHEMARYAVARHGCDPFAPNTWTDSTKIPPGRVNVGLFDGHVELSSLPNLWQYQWHNNWRPNQVFIGAPY